MDLTLKQPGYASVKGSALKILRVLETNGGFSPCHDKSSPQQIHAAFSMSKKEFKKSPGQSLQTGPHYPSQGGRHSFEINRSSDRLAVRITVFPNSIDQAVRCFGLNLNTLTRNPPKGRITLVSAEEKIPSIQWAWYARYSKGLRGTHLQQGISWIKKNAFFG